MSTMRVTMSTALPSSTRKAVNSRRLVMSWFSRPLTNTMVTPEGVLCSL